MPNEININVTASYGGFEAAMQRMADVTGQTMASVRASFSGMSDTASAAIANAAASISTFGPNVQAQAAKIQDLRAALAEVNSQVAATKAIMDEAGASTEIDTSLLNRYNAEVFAQRSLQVELNAAVESYKSALNEVFVAQQEANAVAARSVAMYDQLEAAIISSTGAAGDAIVISKEMVAARAAEAELTAEDAAMYRKLEEAIIAATGARDAMTGGAVAGAGGVAAAESGAGAADATMASVEAVTAARDADTAAIDAENAATERSNISAGEGVVANQSAAEATITRAGAEAALKAALQNQADLQTLVASGDLNAAAAEKDLAAAANAVAIARTRVAEAIGAESAAMQGGAAAANTATEAQLRLARATVEDAAAHESLTRAKEIATAAGEGDEIAMNALAAAQARAAVTARELGLAETAVSEEMAVAGESTDLFRMRLIAGENGMRAFVTSGLTSMPVLIGVIVGGFAVHAVEALQKTELELGNLAAATGSTIAQVGALTQTFQAQGVEENKVESALTFLARSMETAAQGSKKMQSEFKQLGIDTTQWHGTLPPLIDTLHHISEALAKNQNDTEALASASHILGRGQQELIGILREGPAALDANIEKFKGLGQAEQDAYASARALAAQEAALSAQWREIELPLIRYISDAIAGLSMLYAGLKADILDVVTALGLMTAVTNAATIGIGQVSADISTFSFKQAAADAEESAHRISDAFRIAADEIKKHQADASKAITDAYNLRYNPPAMPTRGGESEPIVPSGRSASSSAMAAWREQLREKEEMFQGSHLAMVKMEEDFWQALVDTGKAKGKDLIAVNNEIFKLRMAYSKESLNDMAAERDADDKIRRIQDQENEFFLKSEQQQTKEKFNELSARLKAEADYHAQIAKMDEDAAIIKINMQEDGIREAAKIKMRGTMDDVAVVDKEVADLKAAEDRKLQVQIDYLNQQKALILETSKVPASTLPGGPEAQQTAAMAEATPEQLSQIAKIYKQIEELKAEHTRKMQQLNGMAAEQAKKSAQEAERAWESVFRPVQTAMNQMITGVLRGTQTIQQVFQRFGADVVISITKSLADMALKWAEHFIIVNILEKSSWATRIVETLTGSATKRAVETTANVASVVSSAGAAGAAGFASVMEALPFPVNVAVAPGVMAESIGAVMGNVGLASAAGGMEVPQDMLAMVHKKEMILPADISGGLRGLISTGNTEAGHAAAASTTVNNGRNIHQHVTVNVHGSPGGMTSDDIETAVRRALRMGRLSLANV